MTLVLKIHLDMVKLYHHAKNEVSMSTASTVIAWTDSHMHTDTTKTLPLPHTREVTKQNIELQFLAKVFRFHMKSGGFQVKSTPNLVKSEEFLLKHLHLISETSDFTWNPPDFMKSARFHGEIHWISWISQISWNPPDFMVKSTGFHGEICQISWWNLPDFMVKSTRFHEICQISWMWAFGLWPSIGLSIERPIIGLQFLARDLLISHEICQISWNLHEIWQISGEIHPKPYKIRCFSKNSSDWSFEKQKTYTWSSRKSS